MLLMAKSISGLNFTGLANSKIQDVALSEKASIAIVAVVMHPNSAPGLVSTKVTEEAWIKLAQNLTEDRFEKTQIVTKSTRSKMSTYILCITRGFNGSIC